MKYPYAYPIPQICLLVTSYKQVKRLFFYILYLIKIIHLARAIVILSFSSKSLFSPSHFDLASYF